MSNPDSTTHPTPTVGRRVFYWPSRIDTHDALMTVCDAGQPFEAGIVFVHGDGTVNLVISDHLGAKFAKQQVQFVNRLDGRHAPGCAQWMPYQIAQAASKQDTASIPAEVHAVGGTSKAETMKDDGALREREVKIIVKVSGMRDEPISPLVKDALLELANLRSFEAGRRIPSETVYGYDHGRITVTTKVEVTN